MGCQQIDSFWRHKQKYFGEMSYCLVYSNFNEVGWWQINVFKRRLKTTIWIIIKNPPEAINFGVV